MSILNKIVVASHNEGKVREIRELLIPYGVTTLSAAELSLDEPVETELTFTGNAELKANAAAIASGLPSLSDDSGLVVESLNGDPGIYSARWAKNLNLRVVGVIFLWLCGTSMTFLNRKIEALILFVPYALPFLPEKNSPILVKFMVKLFGRPAEREASGTTQYS